MTLALEPTQVSPTAGWDAAPGRLIERGLSEGQPLSLPRFRFLHLIFGVGLPLASIAAGADGVHVEVHSCPEKATSDGPQALLPAQYAELVKQMRGIAKLMGMVIDPLAD